ncbi:MAG: hypothetical protein FWD26_06670, partial [Treponema sp.]|nr:hypothetical protein [Treponema sp.]
SAEDPNLSFVNVIIDSNDNWITYCDYPKTDGTYTMKIPTSYFGRRVWLGYAAHSINRLTSVLVTGNMPNHDIVVTDIWED